jgi:hypothetical protein
MSIETKNDRFSIKVNYIRKLSLGTRIHNNNISELRIPEKLTKQPIEFRKLKIFNANFFLFFIFFFPTFSQLYAQWVPTNFPYSGYKYGVHDFAISGGVIFAGTYSKGIFFSADNGLSWDSSNTGLVTQWGTYINNFVSANTEIFAGTGSGLFMASNNGNTWTGLGFDTLSVVVGFGGKNLLAGVSQQGIYVSTDNGENWNTAAQPNEKYVTSFVQCGDVTFAGGAGITSSTDGGFTWQRNLDSSIIIWNLAAIGDTLFAGAPNPPNQGVYVSTDKGKNWISKNNGLPGYRMIDGIEAVGGSVFVGIDGGGIFLTTNYGNTWTSADSGLPKTSVWSFVSKNGYLFAGTADSGIWRRPLSEIITSINSNHMSAQLSFKLEQNFPNPFNPNTTIQYLIPKESFVAIKVYDVLGKEIATLLNERKSVGSYSLNFNSSNLPSGVYFYRMQAGSFVSTKKFVLLK